MRVPRGFRYQSIEEKLLFNTEIPVGDDCWLWVGKMSNNGYGEFYWKGKYTSAHRAFYKYFINSNIDGLDVDHLCRHPRCVNPEHLEPVSSRENTLRGVISIHTPKQILAVYLIYNKLSNGVSYFI